MYLMIDSSSTNSIIQIPLLHFLWLVLISFICAFSKRLNDYASHPDEYHSFLLFISEVLLSGVCGVLIGALTKYFNNNIYLITFFTGAGGILGIEYLKIGIKVFLSLRNIKIPDSECIDRNLRDEHLSEYSNNHTIEIKRKNKKKR